MKRALAILSLLVLAACGPSIRSANEIQNAQQKMIDKQAVMTVGMPTIKNFFEKRQLKTIYELRDQAVSTVTYLEDRYGKLHKLCNSIGYGIPYSTEYTNPESPHFSHREEDWYIAAQPDPNGLYSPSTAAGTWVLCLNPKTKRIAPVYAEPNVLVSPFSLQTN